MATAPVLGLRVRGLGSADLAETGRLLHEAFARITRAHGFAPPFASSEEGERLARAYLHLDPGGAVVAEEAGSGGGVIVGCGFIHLRGGVASIGPVAASVRAAPGVGRAVMERLLALARGVPSVRLFQDAFNARSFSLYSKLGFRIHETVAVMASAAPRLLASRGGTRVRVMEDADLALAAQLDEWSTGNSRLRDLEVLRSIAPALVAEREGRMVGFLFVHRAPGRSYLGPGMAHELDDLAAMMNTASLELVQRLLAAGFVVEQLGNLMVLGQTPPPPVPRVLAVFPEGL